VAKSFGDGGGSLMFGGESNEDIIRAVRGVVLLELEGLSLE